MRSTLTSKKGVGIGAKLRAAKVAAKSWVELENSKEVETVETLENRISCIEQKLATDRLGSGEVAVLKAEAQDLMASKRGSAQDVELVTSVASVWPTDG
ncbi:hypothetical protein V6N13_094296 [Hibiscus sabdariffa]